MEWPMYCTNCGSNINVETNFCGNCGQRTANAATQLPSSSPASVPPAFGKVRDKWWGGCIQKGRKPFPESYGWLSERQTLIVFDNHLAIVRESDKSNGAMDVIGTMGLIGGLVDVARAAKNAVANNLASFDDAQAKALYQSSSIVWCEKRETKIWRIEKKKFLGIKTPPIDQLLMPLTSLNGVLNCVFSLRNKPQSLVDPYKTLGVPIETIATNVSDESAGRVWESSFDNIPE